MSFILLLKLNLSIGVCFDQNRDDACYFCFQMFDFQKGFTRVVNAVVYTAMWENVRNRRNSLVLLKIT